MAFLFLVEDAGVFKSSQVKLVLSTQIQNSPLLAPGTGSLQILHNPKPRDINTFSVVLFFNISGGNRNKIREEPGFDNSLPN